MSNVRDLSLRDWMSDKGLAKWVSALGITDAPMRRAGIKTSLQFFQSRMAALPASMASSFLWAMDLSREVVARTLRKGEKVIAFRNRTESEFKLFYTRAGASRHTSGINPASRIAVQYTVHNPTAVLASYTTAAIDVWSVPVANQQSAIAPRALTYGVMVAGGGIQLIIPDAARNLTITNVAN